MPRKPKRACSHPGCPELVDVGQRYCKAHQQAARQRYDRERGTAAQRGYGHRWRKLRQMVLRHQPLCADPFGDHANAGEIEEATEVDHIVPLNRGGTNEASNLQGLCKACHSKKTAIEDGGFGRPVSSPGVPQ